MSAATTGAIDPATIAARINKKLGSDIVVTGSQLVHQTFPRATSGLTGLDMILGGGWPLNQWVEIHGMESSGKTAIAYRTVAANQQRDPEWTCLWIAAEAFVPEWALAHGCDLSRIIVVDTNIMETAYDIVIEYIDNRLVDCVVIDSLAALVPDAENESTMTDWQVGLGARLSGKFFRKVGAAGKRSLVSVDDRPILGLMINQERVNVGGFAPHGMTPKTTPGGWGKNFAYFVRVEVKRTEFIQGDKPDGEGSNTKEKIGQTVKITTEKNKSFRPRLTCAADLYYDTGFDAAKDAFVSGVQAGVIQKKGGWYLFGEDHKWQGRANTIDALRADEDVRNAVIAAVRVEVERHA